MSHVSFIYTPEHSSIWLVFNFSHTHSLSRSLTLFLSVSLSFTLFPPLFWRLEATDTAPLSLAFKKMMNETPARAQHIEKRTHAQLIKKDANMPESHTQRILSVCLHVRARARIWHLHVCACLLVYLSVGHSVYLSACLFVCMCLCVRVYVCVLCCVCECAGASVRCHQRKGFCLAHFCPQQIP